MKKLFATAMCLITVIAFVFAGCSSAPAAQTSAPADAGTSTVSPAQAASAETAPETKGAPVTISLFLAENSSQYNYKDTPNFKAIQKILLDKFNIDYELQTAIGKDFETTVTTMFAGGGTLPDIVDYPYSSDKLVNLYQNGLIIKLNDLVDQNAPNVQQLMKERPYVQIAASDSDGNLLRIPPTYVENPQHRIQVLTIRYDWLQKLGLSAPKTPDDLYNFLKACQDQDVNGSGQKDEVMEAWGNPGLNQVLGTAFGVPFMSNAMNSWYFDANGKIYNTMLMPEAKNYVTYMNKLFTGGLIDQNYLNNTADNYNQKVGTNMMTAEPGAWWMGVLDGQAAQGKGIKDAVYIPLMPAIAEAGKQPMVYNTDLAGYDGYMITKDCKDPVAAIKFIDWGYSPEGSCQNYFGEQYPGGDYYQKATDTFGLTPKPDFQMVYTEKGKKANADDPNLWAKMGWNSPMCPQVLIGNADAVAMEFHTTFSSCGLASDIQFNKDGLNAATTTYAIKACDFATPTADQANQWAGYADLWTYMDDMFGKFITGTEPISNWDSFVSQCQSMGINEATTVKQAEYDAANKILSGN